MAIDYKGGCCEVCGYNRCVEALEFHHNNSNGKDFAISDKGYTRKWTKVKEELDNASYFVPIVTARFMLKVQLSREIGIEKSGEFREACTASQ